MKKLLLVSLLALASPALARAGDVSMRVERVALGPRALESATAPMHFDMLGVQWRGRGAVLYRTRTLAGRWSAWAEAEQTQPVWTGASDRAQFRARGRVSGVRAYYLWSRVRAQPVRTLARAGSPAIVPRSAWFADEKIKRGHVTYAPAIKLAIVHHTAGTNNYTAAQAAAIVRGIEVYHVKANGWNDIGYNFLIDRYGVVYEGRAGGIDKNVIGAHSLGFNTGTVGVSLLGNYGSTRPTAAQQAALVKLLAWRLDVAHVDPLSTVVYTSGGNAKFRAGKVVTLRVISGHRDTGPTECPGAAAYALLPALAQQVSRTGLPKLYVPVVSGRLGGPLRFQARLSSALAWTVTVTDAVGNVVARASGRSAGVDWTWDSSRAGKGPFTWTIAAGPNVLPATGTLGGTVVPGGPLLTGLAQSPLTVAPNADGTNDAATVAFTLGAAATLTAALQDAVGTPVLPLLNELRPAGAGTFTWNARAVPDGRYTLVVTATPAAGTAVTQKLEVIVDRNLTALAATAPFISPNGDGVFDTMTFSFTLAQPLLVRLEIRSGATVVATPFTGPLAAGPHVLDWDGTIAPGAKLPDGAYSAVVVVTDALGDVPHPLPVTVDTFPPVLTLLDAAALRFQLTEPATVRLVVNGQSLVKVAPAGVFTVPFTGPVQTVSAQAQDAAGNASAVVKSP